MADEFTIIRDIGNTLRELLETSIPAFQGSVSFNSPADMQTPAGNQRFLSVFLYQITENASLRNRHMESPDPERAIYPPMVLDLYYLITPYAAGRDDEFDLLERVARIFHDHGGLSGSNLKGMLLESGNEVLRIVQNFLSLEDLNHLWSVFAKPFKTSLAYLVTPVYIPSTRVVQTPRVVQREDRYYQIAQGGRGN